MLVEGSSWKEVGDTYHGFRLEIEAWGLCFRGLRIAAKEGTLEVSLVSGRRMRGRWRDLFWYLPER